MKRTSPHQAGSESGVNRAEWRHGQKFRQYPESSSLSSFGAPALEVQQATSSFNVPMSDTEFHQSPPPSAPSACQPQLSFGGGPQLNAGNGEISTPHSDVTSFASPPRRIMANMFIPRQLRRCKHHLFPLLFCLLCCCFEIVVVLQGSKSSDRRRDVSLEIVFPIMVWPTCMYEPAEPNTTRMPHKQPAGQSAGKCCCWPLAHADSLLANGLLVGQSSSGRPVGPLTALQQVATQEGAKVNDLRHCS